MIQPQGDFEFVEHTADVAIRARGRTLGELFVNSARGLMTLVFGAAILNQEPQGTEPIRIESADQVALLVDWLSELLCRCKTGHRAYIGFESIEVGDRMLDCRAGYIPAEAQEDVKAVTFYDLKIEKLEDRYQATVTYDI